SAFEGGAPELARALGHLRTLRRATGLEAPVHLALRHALPAHAGLGSGTQLALAVGHAFSTAFALGFSSARLAALLGRGARSGAAQSGRAYASEAVGRLVAWIGEDAGAGIGQSSWGPTGFAIVASAQEARRALAAARDAGVVDPALDIRVTAPRNRGGVIDAV